MPPRKRVVSEVTTAETTTTRSRRGRPTAITMDGVEERSTTTNGKSKTPKSSTSKSTTKGRRRVVKEDVSSSPKAKTTTASTPRKKTTTTTTKTQEKVIEEHRANVSAAENKTRKILTRVKMAVVMIAAFISIIYMGHLFVLALVLAVQIGIYRELIKVRYQKVHDQKIPFFRTTQWTIFCLACFHCYGAFIQEKGLTLPILKEFFKEDKKLFENFHDWITNLFFTIAFVLSILQISRRGEYRYQVNNLIWTLVTLLLSVYQLKYTWEIIYEGLFWFVFPASCVVVNDIMAYFSGMLFGRKFIKVEFLSISPNKTWEGFIGAFFFTMIFAYFFSDFLWQFKYLQSKKAEIYPIFQWDAEDWPGREKELRRPVWANFFENAKLLQNFLETIRLYSPLKSVLEKPDALYESINTTSKEITEYISSITTPVQLHAMALGFFASLVAPFGGFLMSAIKRAFNLKDFDSIIPGHGGLTDRCDCQLIMLWFVKVYYDFFIKERAPIIPLKEQCMRLNTDVLSDICQTVCMASMATISNDNSMTNNIDPSVTTPERAE